MIKSFRHQGLEALYRKGNASGVMGQHQHDLKTILALLDSANSPKALTAANRPLKQLAGDLADYYSLELHPGWQVIFCFEGSDVTNLNYIHLPQKQTSLVQHMMH